MKTPNRVYEPKLLCQKCLESPTQCFIFTLRDRHHLVRRCEKHRVDGDLPESLQRKDLSMNEISELTLELLAS
jgi:hypothetical protein